MDIIIEGNNIVSLDIDFGLSSTLTIQPDSTLIVNPGIELVNGSSLIINNNGTLTIEGNLVNSNSGGVANHACNQQQWIIEWKRHFFQ